MIDTPTPSEKYLTVTVTRGNLAGILVLLVAIVAFSVLNVVQATTPNPGHPWTDVGNGNWQVANTQTGTRTFTFPDASANVLTDNARVTVAQGGTGWGAVQAGTIPYGNGTSALSTTTAGTPGYVLSLLNGIPTWAATTTLSTISGILGLSSGGTNANLTAVNGGIVYSGTSAFAISAAGSAGQMLQSGGAASPTWTIATYPSTAGTSGKIMQSNGTNFVASTPTFPTTGGTAGQVLTSDGTNWTTSTTSDGQITLPASGSATANSAVALGGSLTTRHVGLFYVPQTLTINQITFNVSAWTAAGVVELCIYDKYGNNKLADISTASITATGVKSTTVSPAVTLVPDYYYIADGCKSGTCTMSLSHFTTTANAWINGASIPAGKPIYEGTVTHTSGTCNTTLGTITAAAANTLNARLDN